MIALLVLLAAAGEAVEASGDVTQITLTYTVGGYYPSGLDKLAEAVDGVFRGQLERLGMQAETP